MDEQRRHVQIVESIFRKYGFRMADAQPVEKGLHDPFGGDLFGGVLRYCIVEDRPLIELEIDVRSDPVPIHRWATILLTTIEEAQRSDHHSAAALLTAIYKEVVAHQEPPMRTRQP